MQRSSILRHSALTTLAALALLAAGCGSSTTTSNSPATITDTFSGTIVAGGFDSNVFTVNAGGTVTISLVTLAPQSTITMGIGVGTLGTNCSLFSQNETFHAASTPFSGDLTAGVYCYVLYDVGNVVGADTYTLTVLHP
jgi:hypothetical protein